MKLSPHSIRGLMVSVVLLMGTSGCSTFNSEWRKAATIRAPADAITGRWEGSWLSDRNGHRGRLRCLVTRLDEEHYRARYKATWWKIFRFGYTVTMETERSGAVFAFRGEADLGWWAGGLYRYEGQAASTNFFSSYKSKYDHGTFQMQRPQ